MADEPTVEWLIPEDSGRDPGGLERLETLERSGPSLGGSPWLLAVLVGAVALGSLALVVGGGGPAPPIEQTPAPVEEPPVPVDGTDPLLSFIEGPAGGPSDALAATTFRAIVQSVDGSAGLITFGPDGETRLTGLPDFTRMEFDASGQWVAGIGVNRRTGRSIIWAGPVSGPLEPVTVGSRHFAWHGERAGTLAWSVDNRRAIEIADLTALASPARIELPVRGGVRGWGEWGFAVQTSNIRFATSIVTPSGEPVLLDQPGRYSGFLPEVGVLLTGRGQPTFVDPKTGVATDVPWLDDHDMIWSLDAAADGRLVAVVSEDWQRTSSAGTEVWTITDGRVSVVAQADGDTEVAFDADDRWVLLTNLPDSLDMATSVIALDTVSGDRLILDVPRISESDQRLSALDVID